VHHKQGVFFSREKGKKKKAMQKRSAYLKRFFLQSFSVCFVTGERGRKEGRKMKGGKYCLWSWLAGRSVVEREQMGPFSSQLGAIRSQ